MTACWHVEGDMEESRKQFEAWFSNDGKYPEAVDKSGRDYLLASACAAWEAWVASRATVDGHNKAKSEGLDENN